MTRLYHPKHVVMMVCVPAGKHTYAKFVKAGPIIYYLLELPEFCEREYQSGPTTVREQRNKGLFFACENAPPPTPLHSKS